LVMRGSEPRRYLLRLGHPGRQIRVRIRDREHSPAVARDPVILPDRRAYALGKALEHLVAGQMAMVIVNALEMIEVCDQHSERPTIPARAFDFESQLIGEVTAIVRSHERVGDREQLDLSGELDDATTGLEA